MSVQVYLYFNGNCREAVEFYAKAFNTPVQQIMTYGQAPGTNVSESEGKRILYTFLMIQGSMVMFSDCPSDMDYIKGSHMAVTVGFSDEAALRKAFDMLKENGTVDIPLGATFFNPCYGMLTDQFGMQWQLSLDAAK